MYDSSYFYIYQNQLRLRQSLDYERTTKVVSIKVIDSNDLTYVKDFTFTVEDTIDESPTDISLSATSFSENITSGSE